MKKAMLTLLAVFIACSAAPSEPSRIPEGPLRPLSGAAEVEVQDQIPADWRPLEHDFLNAGSPSSHSTGWQSFGDMTTQPASVVYQWMAQWESPEKAILAYTLRYRDEVAGPGWYHPPQPRSTRLKVIGMLLPPDQAQVLRSQAEAPN
jgi:hypothetical protein